MDLNDLTWRKSSLSGNNGGDCVEVAELAPTTPRPTHKPDATYALRDSKNPIGPVLYFTPSEWQAFLRASK
ncbi:DUF397 domain-containing protein [Planomonospora venezuelensis]|uniref:DUF397 domain-containing protein n=1 Tax=Planomonospora venezuelensis TaxID=1999 RepID=A0A841D1W0_PLAVE|nr:DUF397 domain-containing protein [Planomonospora venezuelensis]MBB5962973.1 hypothetical protein [Planomonospora venezuelensis]GIN00541.1 hypothetical protein Pve01_21990 [Planomonospora venezuelensis]